jgi:hypothetical protein
MFWSKFSSMFSSIVLIDDNLSTEEMVTSASEMRAATAKVASRWRGSELAA